MTDDTAHGLDEFNNFPWHLLEKGLDWRHYSETERKSILQVGGISRGGIVAEVDFNPRKPHIDFLRQNGSADAWEIPEALAALTNDYFNRGHKGRTQEIQDMANELVTMVFGERKE